LLLLLDEFQPTAIDEGCRAPGEEDAAPSTWLVHFDAPASRDRAIAAIDGAFGPLGLAVRAREVQDEGWVERSQALLTAIQVDAIVVAPPWDVPVDAGGGVVVIRPSMGFGTGHHASTRLCLRALQRLDVAGRSVLDVGTGSGVLAIAAVTLGARPVVAIDCDPDAIANARENASANGVSDQIVLHVADVGDAGRIALSPSDVVLANLTAGVLRQQADRLCGLTAAGGCLIVSGILCDQVDAVVSAFQRDSAQMMRATRIDHEGEWVVVTFGHVERRPASDC
jgi:ribosomal protein L11 methyltransferase